MIRNIVRLLSDQFKFSIMDPSETTLTMQQQLSLMSASFVPNYIQNQEDDDQSFDQLGKQFVFKQPQHQQQQQSEQEKANLRVTVNQYSKTAQVVASDLRNFVKSKQDLYIILTIEGQLHLPPFDDCTMEFMRDALSGKKKLLTNRDLCPVTVPRYKEFNSTQLEQMAYQDEDIRVYLPD